MSDRADDIAPTAAALVAAVRDEDPAEVAAILTAPGLDWMALAVVLADQARLTPSQHYIGSVLHDLATSGTRRDAIARRYGLSKATLARIAEDNAPAVEQHETWSPDVLGGGRWIARRGIQVWVNDDEREAG